MNCIKCGIFKIVELFYHFQNGKTSKSCLECKPMREIVPGTKKCHTCLKQKEITTAFGVKKPQRTDTLGVAAFGVANATHYKTCHDCRAASALLREKSNYHKTYYLANKHAMNANTKNYYNKYNEQLKAWRSNHKWGQRVHSIVYNSKKSDLLRANYNADTHIDACFVRQLLFEQDSKCIYCLIVLDLDAKMSDTTISIERIDNSLSHSKRNSCLCCLKCNRKRGNRYDFFTFSDIIKRQQQNVATC